MKRLIYHKHKSIRLPEAIDELEARQLRGIAGVIHSGVNKLKGSLIALRILSKKSWIGFMFLSADVKLRCIEHVQWIFDDLMLTDQLIPEFKGFHGPKSEFNNMKLAEFHASEIYYQQTIKQEPGALDNLVAVLYRKAKKNYDPALDSEGDIRIKFNGNEVAYYAKQVRHWPKNLKYAILMFYDGCRKKIQNDHDEIFTSGDQGDIDTGMYGIMRGLAGPRFGDLEKVEEMYLHHALLEISILIKEEEKLKAQYKTA